MKTRSLLCLILAAPLALLGATNVNVQQPSGTYTDNAIVRRDGTGNLVQNSDATLNDQEALAGLVSVNSYGYLQRVANIPARTVSANTWIGRTAAGANTWFSVAWSPELGLFAAVSAGDNQTSQDGITWTARTAAEANTWTDICWSPQLGLFAAVSSAGATRIQTSPDGITWTGRTAAEANNWQGIAWSPQLGLFAAISANGTNRVQTSPDGINWTARAAAEANTWIGIAWSPQLGLFAAASQDGTNRIMTSPDGITWTARAAAAANSWREITWSPELGLFAAVSLDGATRIQTSPDGITWTGRTAAEANLWQSIEWSPQLGLFAAISSNGATRIQTSPDGITWTGRTAAEANTWSDIVWSPKLGFFCAVSQDGTTRVMNSPGQGIPGNYAITYGVGTAYAFTNAAAAIDFGTTDPVIVIPAAGTYLITGQVQVDYTGATVAAETATLTLRRTNNTAADIPSTAVVIDLPASTVLTHTYGIVPLPPAIYTTANRDDSITIFANVSAALGAGTIDATAPGTVILATRLY